jgi:hypothetical protein
MYVCIIYVLILVYMCGVVCVELYAVVGVGLLLFSRQLSKSKLFCYAAGAYSHHYYQHTDVGV